MELQLLSGFLIGIAGSFHCAGMCGPIAMALPVAQHASRTSFTTGRLMYQAGRITTYATLGALAGLGAGAIALAGYERTISIVAGSLMILAAVMQLLWHRSLIPSAPLVKLTAPVRSSMQRLLQRNSTIALFGIGLVNGLLPCGLVLAAIFGSAATTSAIDGAVFMASFGLGTLPMMTMLSLGGAWIMSRLRGRYRLVMPILALMLGGLVIVRGMGLGIPYVSPAPPVAEHAADCCSEE
ncbi:MAG: sulfite exporter TauE/SafE family protein [Ignavibacteriae bacterium]|nr:MAG: sulfite exporter TauE/SafE family protein [Ignavibacteriota bacterium]